MTTPRADRSSERWWSNRQLFVNAAVALALLALMLWWSFVPAASLSEEGVRLLSRGALLAVLVLVTAFARTIVGRNPKRNVGMLMGTLGGMAAGIAVAAPLSRLFGTDVSSLSAICGVILGWAVAYQFVKHIPRRAS